MNKTTTATNMIIALLQGCGTDPELRLKKSAFNGMRLIAIDGTDIALENSMELLPSRKKLGKAEEVW